MHLMKRVPILVFSLLLSFFFFTACKKPVVYPAIPAITLKDFTMFKSLTGTDSIGVLRLNFTDGDGDLGLHDADTLPPFDKNSKFYYNVFTKYYEKRNGVWVELTLPFPDNFRIPFLTADGRSKAMKGEIIIQMPVNPFAFYDTIKYDVWIADRALHESNVVTTNDIIL